MPSHTTKTHGEVEKTKLAGGNMGGGQPPLVAPPPVVNANTLSEAKIANYERTSTDPNAGSIAEAMRTMMLNGLGDLDLVLLQPY